MASKRAVRRRSCEGKVRHASHTDAIIALSVMKRAGKCQSDARVYRCKFCGGYHIGHMTDRQLAAQRASD